MFLRLAGEQVEGKSASEDEKGKKCFSEDQLKQFILDVNSTYRLGNKTM